MEAHIDFQKTIRSMQRQFQELEPRKFQASVASALNKTAAKAKTQASREIRSIYKIAVRELNKSLSLRKASGMSNRLEASVNAEGKPLPAMAFQARPNKRGKGVTINVKGTRKLLEGAFIRTMKSGHKGVFARVQPGKYYYKGELKGRRHRIRNEGNDLPIGEVKSVGVPRGFSNAAVIKALERKSRDDFPPTLLHELKWRSGQLGGE